MKVLFSWLAFANDFLDDGILVNPEGFTVEFYMYHYRRLGYHKHVILRTSDMPSIRKTHNLVNYLKTEFKNINIDVQEIELKDITNINEIKNKVQLKLMDYRNHEVDFLIGSGTALMQLVWYFLHESTDIKTHLVQPVRKEYWNNKVPKLIQIELKKSSEAYSFMLLAKEKERKEKEMLITETLQAVYDRAGKIAFENNVTALILGASGTGKELVARYIHEQSDRHHNPFIAINCAALNDNLLESRLFGHKKGAFTGALNNQTGILKAADGGTVFLDEIGDISPYMQVALLRFLQEREIFPVGGTKAIKTDVRIIAATNQNLEELCRQGKFRWDLYYRLAVAVLNVPSFALYSPAERKQYIQFFIDKKQKALGKKKKLELTKETLKVLVNYTFPGNFRELENLIEQLYVFSNGIVDSTLLPERLFESGKNSDLTLKSIEKQHIVKVLRLFKGNLTHSSKAMGIALNTLKNKMRAYGIKSSEFLG